MRSLLVAYILQLFLAPGSIEIRRGLRVEWSGTEARLISGGKQLWHGKIDGAPFLAKGLKSRRFVLVRPHIGFDLFGPEGEHLLSHGFAADRDPRPLLGDGLNLVWGENTFPALDQTEQSRNWVSASRQFYVCSVATGHIRRLGTLKQVGTPVAVLRDRAAFLELLYDGSTGSPFKIFTTVRSLPSGQKVASVRLTCSGKEAVALARYVFGAESPDMLASAALVRARAVLRSQPSRRTKANI